MKQRRTAGSERRLTRKKLRGAASSKQDTSRDIKKFLEGHGKILKRAHFGQKSLSEKANIIVGLLENFLIKTLVKSQKQKSSSTLGPRCFFTCPQIFLIRFKKGRTSQLQMKTESSFPL